MVEKSVRDHVEFAKIATVGPRVCVSADSGMEVVASGQRGLHNKSISVEVRRCAPSNTLHRSCLALANFVARYEFNPTFGPVILNVA